MDHNPKNNLWSVPCCCITAQVQRGLESPQGFSDLQKSYGTAERNVSRWTSIFSVYSGLKVRQLAQGHTANSSPVCTRSVGFKVLITVPCRPDCGSMSVYDFSHVGEHVTVFYNQVSVSKGRLIFLKRKNLKLTCIFQQLR